MDEAMERRWQELSEEVLSGMKEWRQSHPKATFWEIEQAVQERLSRLETQMLQDVALASKQRDWSPTEAPRCPVCETPLQKRGRQIRSLQGRGGKAIRLERSYGTCPVCGTGLFPLDRELHLLPGSLTPSQHEHLVHLGAWMPFGKASQMLTKLLGVRVSEATARRMTERMGAQVEAAQTKASDQPAETEPWRESEKKQAISADGAYVPLVKGEWAEVRTVVIGEVEGREPGCDKQEVHVTHLSYFSRMTPSVTFADLAEGEMRRRGVRQAKAA